MIKNSSKPSDGYSESPSSRPMTLRQQLEEILKANYGYHVANRMAYHKTRDALEALCQEIAREARLDELNMMANHSWSAHRTYLFDRIAELTQKPPQEEPK